MSRLEDEQRSELEALLANAGVGGGSLADKAAAAAAKAAAGTEGVAEAAAARVEAVVASLPSEAQGELQGLLKELVQELAFQEGSRLTLMGQNDKLRKDAEKQKQVAERARLEAASQNNAFVAYPGAGASADGGNKTLESGLEGAAAYNQLQADYEADKVLFRRNESELKEALTSLRADKKHLETELERMQRDADFSFQDMERKTAAAILRLKEQHEGELSALAAKNKWYRENQELVDSNTDRLKQQTATITKLRNDLRKKSREQRGDGDVGAGNGGSSAARVRVLEQQLADAEERLRSRNPDSLSSMIRAARPDQVCFGSLW